MDGGRRAGLGGAESTELGMNSSNVSQSDTSFNVCKFIIFCQVQFPELVLHSLNIPNGVPED